MLCATEAQQDDHLPSIAAGESRYAVGFAGLAGQTGAVFRLHPAGSTVPIMVLSGGAIAFLLLSTVSIRVLHKTPGGLAAAGTPPIAAASAIPNPAGSSQGQQGSGLGNQGVVSSPAADIGPGSAGSAVNPAGSPSSPRGGNAAHTSGGIGSHPSGIPPIQSNMCSTLTASTDTNQPQIS